MRPVLVVAVKNSSVVADNKIADYLGVDSCQYQKNMSAGMRQH